MVTDPYCSLRLSRTPVRTISYRNLKLNRTQRQANRNPDRGARERRIPSRRARRIRRVNFPESMRRGEARPPLLQYD